MAMIQKESVDFSNSLENVWDFTNF